MKLLMLNYEFPPFGGGSANATWHLIRELERHSELRVDLITSGTGKRPECERMSASVRIFRLPVGKKAPLHWTAAELARWTVRADRLAHRLARTRSYDLCHCWSGWPPGWIGHRLRRRLPYLVALRGSDVPGYNERLRRLDPALLRPLSRRIWRRAAAVTAVSERLRRLAARTAPDVPIEVIRNGVDCGRFRPRTWTRSGPFTLLYVGRLIPRKGLEHLLEAFRLCVASGREPMRLLLAGDGSERARLERLVAQLDLAGAVTFLGAVGRERLPLVYEEADVFVLPALEEALSNAALEAMACGLPVLTTDTGVAEVVGAGGSVIPAGDARAIARQLERYRDDRTSRRSQAAAARSIAETMSWSSVADAYLALYGRILREAGPARAARAPAESAVAASGATGARR